MSEVSVVADAAQVAEAAAELFVEAAAGAVAARGTAVVALTGGSTAAALYRALREEPFRSKVPWGALQMLTGDERAVPPGDPRSNWSVAETELFQRVPVRIPRLHRMRGEAEDLAEEARRFARELRSIAGDPPRLDLLLLGLGPDGHILSLFAGVPSSAQRSDAELVRAVDAPLAVEPRVPRLTLSPLLVLTARNVVVQVTGAAKAEALTRALQGSEDLAACPAQWLRRAAGRVVVVADAAAAARLGSQG